MNSNAKTRFDASLSRQQKEFFEYAANLGGFKSLTEFIVFSAQQQASRIVESHQTILASQKDRAVFFDAVMHPPKPNAKLKKAAQRYRSAGAKK